MKKRELLKLPQMKCTQAMKEKAEEAIEVNSYKWVYETEWEKKNIAEKQRVYHKMLRARMDNDILQIFVFFGKDIVDGKHDPQYRIFFDGKEQATYDNRSKKWRTCKIDFLQNEYMDGENRIYNSGYDTSQKTYSSTLTDQIVCCYLDNGQTRAYDAILEEQCRYKGIKKSNKFKKEQEKMQSFMDQAEKLPKDFEKWVNDVALFESRYIYYRYPSKTGHCTHCKRTVNISGQKHNEKGKCPNCRSEITYKAIKKSATINDDGTAFYLQKYNDEYMMRTFRVLKYYASYRDPFFCYTEVERTKLDRWFRPVERYKNISIKDGEEIWKKGEYTEGFSWSRHNITKGKLYYKNLDKVLSKSELRYVPIREMLKNTKDKKIEVYLLLQTLCNERSMEYMVKMKLYNFVTEYINKDYSIYSCDLYNGNERKPWKALRISKKYLNLFKEKDWGIKELRILQNATEGNLNLTKDQIEILSGELGNCYREVMQAMQYATPHKAIRYALETMPDKKNRWAVKNWGSDYADYLKICKKLEYDVKNEFVLFPKNLKEQHDLVTGIWTEREADEKAEKANEARANENKKITKLYKKWQQLYQFETEDMQIVIPGNVGEIVREGHRQRHCVATYTGKVAEGKSIILFIREKKDLDKNFYTMEVSQEGEIVQVRGKRNDSMTEEVEQFVEQFKKAKLEKRRKKVS